MQTEARTFIDILAHHAATRGNHTAFRYLTYTGGEVSEQEITYRELYAQARNIARHLLSACRPGDRALMLYPSGIEFICAYFGCLYSGIIAVPAYPPKRNQKLGRLRALVDNCQAAVTLTDAHTQAIAGPQFAEMEGLSALPWLMTDRLSEVADSEAPLPDIQPDQIAFLQYTSGSTGDPKGVMVTHGNLMANSHCMHDAMAYDANTVVVSWLPVFHDMGLIGSLLQTVFAGCTCVLMSPAAFLQRPLRWLEAISRYRATISGAPNFAYDLCVSGIPEEELARLDLRSWRIAANGAEPIRPDSLRAFSRKFAACGFDHRAHMACYGMAETTLMISSGEAGQGIGIASFDGAALQRNRALPAKAGAEESHEVVCCGVPRREQRVRVVNPDTRHPCADGEVGEIWTRGDSNAKGYWQRPDATAATFSAYLADPPEGPFLRTGDLGFIHQGQLYVTGRLKDVLIIRGANHYPQDLEQTAFESHPAFVPNGAAAFGIAEDGQEKLVVVLEVRRTFLRDLDPPSLSLAVQQAIAVQHELQVHSVVFIKPGQLPKTSSGKVQRQTCKALFLDDALDELARTDRRDGASDTAPLSFDKAAWLRQSDHERLDTLRQALADAVERTAALPAGTVRPDITLMSYGLDSLALTQLAGRLSEVLDIDLQVQYLFEFETVEALAAHLQECLLHAAQRRPQIAPAPWTEDGEGKRYPLSFAQQRMWFLQKYEAGSLYNLFGTLRIEGALNVPALERSLREIVERHDALRTRFVETDAEPHQRVLDGTDWRLTVIDCGNDPEAWAATMAHERDFVFDLAHGPLFRATLLTETPLRHTLAVVMHHIISDGWSISVLMNELSERYAAHVQDQTPRLPPLPIQYPDFAVWQRAALRGETLARQETYWLNQLKDVEPLHLPLDRPRPGKPSFAGSALPFRLDAALTRQLQALSKAQGVTLYMTLLASFGLLLHKYSGQNDFCIGTPIANRTAPETKDLIGFFVNTLVLRLRYAGDPRIADVLQYVKAVTVNAYAHQDLPFEKVVNLFKSRRDVSISPLFQVMFVLQDRAMGSVSLPGLTVRRETLPSTTAKFEITLELQETPDGLVGQLEYKTALFDAATIERMSGHFRRLLEAIVQAPEAPLSALSFLGEEERAWLLDACNRTERPLPAETTVPDLVRKIGLQRPDAVALLHHEQAVRYGDLIAAYETLAGHLHGQGVRGGDLIGLSLPRGVDLVVAMLAVWRCGAAWLPLDPDYPAERIAFMLADAKPGFILAHRDGVPRLPRHTVKVVCLDDPFPDDPGEAPVPEISPTGREGEQLAYVIYTSGSTGQPKGVLCHQRGLINLQQAHRDGLDLRPEDRVLQFASMNFDAAVAEIAVTLCVGATLVLADREIVTDLDRLTAYLERQRVTVATLPPAVLRRLDPARVHLRTVVSAGEACSLALAKAWSRNRLFINGYGPTECAVCSTLGRVEPDDPAAPGIGRPIDNTRVHIVDVDRHLAPVGVVGEIWLGGVGLASGYLNRPELTAERFVPDPFGQDGRLYRTGDLARRRSDGSIEYVGRRDFQEKIRGFRVEPGEIEVVLARHPDVRECAVLAFKDAVEEKYLAAFVVGRSGPPDVSELRRFLGERLPDYMVPTRFVPLDALPLNAHGKLDRTRLPDPAASGMAARPYVMPRSESERDLAQLFAEVLHLERVGIEDNFFEIGGHSLLATQMISRLRETFGVDVSLADFFANPTVAGLDALVAVNKAQTLSDEELERLLADIEKM